MTEHDDVDQERAALISKRISQTFNFARDVVDDPRTLEVIPSGSTLTFRDVEIAGRQFRLVAYRLPGATNRWAARLTGASPSMATTGHGVMVPASIESDISAGAALDAFASLFETIATLASEPAQHAS
jgi:hypothetical protein